jgi:hypothetical protein
MLSKATTELLVITKLSDYEEAPVTMRILTLLPRFLLVATWSFKPAAGLLAGLALLLSAMGAAGQGTFQNLDFESANIPSGTQPYADLSFGDAFPGWSGFYGSGNVFSPATFVVYDALSLGGPMMAIIDKVTSYKPYQALQGNYSAFLFGGNSPFGGPTTMTISQTGLVPYGAVSVFMDVDAWNGFSISLGGHSIVTMAGPYSGEFTADISAFAGQTVQLSITVPSSPYGDINPDGLLIDGIRFETVPEPGIIALSAFGTLLVGWRFKERRR